MIASLRAWEWPTIGLLLGCAGLWFGAVFVVSAYTTLGAVAVVALVLVLHASLSHEILHGHPFASKRVNEAIGIVQPGLFVPYLRFRDTHLAHHREAQLTDPYDDPESNFLDPAVWKRMTRLSRALFRFNNTLLGRMVVGPLIGQVAFMRADWALVRAGDRSVLGGWLWHLPGIVAVLWVVWGAVMPLWAYVLAAYFAMSILKIRTFLEHRAHSLSRARTVIIERQCILSFLFLNNSLHVVHHMHPDVAWYDLPARYRAQKARYLAYNEGYVFASYSEIFARFFLRAKDPVAHPLWPQD